MDRSSAPRTIPHRTSEQRVQAIAALRRLRFTGPEIAEMLGMALSTVSGILTRLEGLRLDGIDWLIVGGESGPRHRRVDADWIRDLRDRCAREDVAFFFKQWGGPRPKSQGRKLDGREWDELPRPKTRRLALAS